MSSGAEASEPLKCQTWVLKVSIHCEGCKKKVKKVLQGFDGVYRITVDAQLQKVTVTGNVEANLLMKRLSKAGKHAELWPEKNPDSQSPTLASATVGKKNTKKGDGNAVSPFGNPEKTSEEEDSSVSDQPATIACEEPKKPNETGTAAPSPPQEKLAGVEADKPSPAVAAKKKVKNSPTNPISASGSEEKTTDINGKQGLPLIRLPSTAYSSQLPAYILSCKHSTTGLQLWLRLPLPINHAAKRLSILRSRPACIKLLHSGDGTAVGILRLLQRRERRSLPCHVIAGGLGIWGR